eukprot:6358975-Alexandrium_andersonii.AAC.1
MAAGLAQINHFSSHRDDVQSAPIRCVRSRHLFRHHPVRRQVMEAVRGLPVAVQIGGEPNWD